MITETKHPDFCSLSLFESDIPITCRPGDDAPPCAFTFQPARGAPIEVSSRVVLGEAPSLASIAARGPMARARAEAIDRCRKLGLRAMTEL